MGESHDLELTALLGGVLENYNFKEKVDEYGLSFDYQLNSGPSTTRNAIQLLNYLGYPSSIVASARERVEED